MEIVFQIPFGIICSQKLCNFVGWLHRIDSAMGFALPPNTVVLRSKTHPMNSQWLVHEKTHHKQNWETLWLIQIFTILEYLLFRLKGKTNREAYILKTVEQEAYANQHNPNYLKERKFWAFTKYLKYKPVLDVKENFEVKLA